MHATCTRVVRRTTQPIPSARLRKRRCSEPRNRTYVSGDRPCSSARSASAMTPSAAASVSVPISASLAARLCSGLCGDADGVAMWLRGGRQSSAQQFRQVCALLTQVCTPETKRQPEKGAMQSVEPAQEAKDIIRWSVRITELQETPELFPGGNARTASELKQTASLLLSPLACCRLDEARQLRFCVKLAVDTSTNNCGALFRCSYMRERLTHRRPAGSAVALTCVGVSTWYQSCRRRSGGRWGPAPACGPAEC